MDPLALVGVNPVGFNPSSFAAPLGLLGAASTRCQPGQSAPPDALNQLLTGNQTLLNQLSVQLMTMILGLMTNQNGAANPLTTSAGINPVSQGGGAADSSASQSTGTSTSTGSDSQTAQFIDSVLQKKNPKAAEAHFGELAVKYGRENDVDPMILLAIAGHETGFGKLGVGLNGLLGVGAYDSDPNNSTRNSKFSGVEQQLKVGAKTFANLRKKGGATSKDSVEKQLEAVNKGGWATDSNWHTGVAKMFQQVSQGAPKT